MIQFHWMFAAIVIVVLVICMASIAFSNFLNRHHWHTPVLFGNSWELKMSLDGPTIATLSFDRINPSQMVTVQTDHPFMGTAFNDMLQPITYIVKGNAHGVWKLKEVGDADTLVIKRYKDHFTVRGNNKMVSYLTPVDPNNPSDPYVY